jgi:UTP--glucose-1-phosphate uridylyltransferase
VNVRAGLVEFPHDPSLVEDLGRRLRAGELDRGVGDLSPGPLVEGDVRAWPTAETAHPLRDLRESGEKALAAGQVAVAILAGGMATRFGGVAKAAVSLRGDGQGPSFLQWQLDRIAAHRRRGARVPVVVIVSFATRDAVLHHLDAIDWGDVPPDDRHVVVQSIVPRHDAGAGAPLPDDPTVPDRLAYAAPGHGEVLERLRASGTVERLGSAGVEHVVVTNCDNLGATLDAAGVGMHLHHASPLTVEVVSREPGDKGGPIARVDGRPVIVEGFRLAPDVDVEQFGWFNTNTLWFQRAALERTLSLDWFAVRRTITLPDGERREVVQTEQLIGQATEQLPACFVGVDRHRRFLPIKTRQDLVDAAPEIERRLSDPTLTER